MGSFFNLPLLSRMFRRSVPQAIPDLEAGMDPWIDDETAELMSQKPGSSTSQFICDADYEDMKWMKKE